MAGVSPAAICNLVKRGRLVVNAAGRLDPENPFNARYIQKHRRRRREQVRLQKHAPAAAVSGPVSAPGAAGLPPPDEEAALTIEQIAGLPERMLSLPVRDLVARFNGVEGIERYAKILRDLTLADEKTRKSGSGAARTSKSLLSPPGFSAMSTT